jgi:UDP-N-acetylmuramoyl-L-alanyl-D-glutamate--2,6-diaminopimelate ligase
MMAAVATVVMTLGELLGPQAGEHAGIELGDLVVDSRQARPGAAFVALPGSSTHGLEFADAALARGAVAVLYEPVADGRAVPQPSVAVPALGARLGELARRFFGHGREPVTLVGVTGTNGKSTVAYLTAAARTELGTPCGYIGTLGYGIPPSLASQTLTTPDCLTLHRHLRALGVGEVAMEVSSHAIAQNRIAGLTFKSAVFTNLSRDHLDFHGDLERYKATKAQLFARDGLETAVVFVDDPFGAELARSVSQRARTLTVSLMRDADIVGRITASSLDGLTIDAHTPAGGGTIESPLIGDINAENLLLALGALLTLDAPVDAACAALGRCAGLPGRMQLFGGSGQPWVVVDYAHTPDALLRVLTDLRTRTQGELWCVFGCGGGRDVGKRPEMGRAASIAEHVVITDDNPRNESPRAIVADILRGVPHGCDVVIEHDRRKAIASAIAKAQSGDVVLIAGKGHETVQIVGQRSLPFDDRRVVAELLGAVA